MPQPTRTPGWQSSFNLALNWIEQSVREGLSFRSYYSSMRDAGLSYNRSRMLQDWRSVQGIYLHEASIQAMSPTTNVPFAWTTEGKTGQQQPFLALVDYTYTDPLTGQDKHGTRVISSTRLMEKGRYEDTAENAFAPGRPYADPSARDFNMRAILRRPDVLA